MIYVIIIYLFFTYPIFRKISNKKIVLLLEILPMFLILAFQNAIGTDFYSYIKIFNGEKSFEYSRGPLFKIIIIYLKHIFNHERAMFIVVAGIQTTLYYSIIKFLYKKGMIKNIPLFIYLSITSTTFYFMLFNGLRSSIASLFIVLSILMLLDNKIKKSFFLILLGSTFHPSVFIWNGIFVVKKFLYKKTRIKLLVFILVCFLLNKLNFIQNMAKLIYETGLEIPYRNYLISSHMFPYVNTFGIGIIVNMIIFLFSLEIIYKKEKNKKRIFIYNIGYLFLGLSLLFANIPIFTRLLEPSNLFKTYIVYNLTEKLLRKQYFYLGVIFIIYYSIYFIRASFLSIPAIL